MTASDIRRVKSISGGKKILIFDSGIGGLTIFSEVKKVLPDVSILYASDNQGFPYGKKSELWLVDRLELMVNRLVEVYCPDIIVVACNTASTVALPSLREKIKQPVVGVVPAIKPAALLSKSKVLGLLATPATVQRPYTNALIKQFAADCRVVRVGSSELVEMAERKMQGEAVDLVQLQSIIGQFFLDGVGQEIDTIVLGCTHFPLLKEEIEQVLPCQINLIDSASSVAIRVRSIYNEQFPDMLLNPPLPSYRFLYTEATKQIERLRPQLVALQFEYFELVTFLS